MTDSEFAHAAGGDTTPAVLDRMAGKFPDDVVLVTEVRRLTFAQLRAEVRQVAGAMIATGVQAGDAVAICLPNTWHWVVTALAAHYAGGVVVPVNTEFTARELTDVLARTSAPVLVAMGGITGADLLTGLDRGAVPALRRVVQVSMTANDEAAFDMSWEEFVTGPKATASEIDARAAAVSPDHVSDILFTSGTTGRSKGVLCTHRQSLSASGSWAHTGTLNRADRYLCINPFFHNFGYKAGILACLQTGATLIPQRSFDPGQILRTVQNEQITVMPGSPTLFQLLLDHPDRPSYDLSSLRMVVTGAALVPVVLIERMRRELDIDLVLTAYGLTEACGFGTMCRPGDDPYIVATTCGRPIAGFEIRIDAPDGTGAGEVLLRGPNIMLGYLNDPAATAEAVDDAGWLHTGDVGTLDTAGNLRITDRLTDMYICGGSNVYPAEVEQVVAGLAGVAEVAVIGVPDQMLGEVGRMFVVARPDAGLDEQAVITHVRRHLANFKTPRSVVFLDALPRNPAGKVLKNVLRQDAFHAVGPPRGSTPRGLGGPPVGRMEIWISLAWQALLDIDQPGRLDRFTDLGGNSLSAVELSRMLKEHFGIVMSVDRFADNPTIAALAKDVQADSSELRHPVVQLRNDGHGPVYLMVPGWAGNALNYTALAPALAAPCEVVSLSLTHLDSASGPTRSAIRSAALAAVRHQAAAGRPIVIAGYSFGALVATDLACWLPEQGVPVAHLYLLDPNPLDSDRPRRQRKGVRARVGDAVLRLSPPLYWAIRKRRNPELAATAPWMFDSGCDAARQLHDEVEGDYAKLEGAYQDGSIHLPGIPVSWIQSRAMSLKYKSAREIYGTPVGQVDRELAAIDFHADVLQKSNATTLSEWIDRHSPWRDCPVRVDPAAAAQTAMLLWRKAFDPPPELADIRAMTGVATMPTAFGAKTYVITRYDDVRKMLVDHERFSNSPPWVASGARSTSAGGEDDPQAGNLMVLDPPEHTRLRRMLAAQFTTQRVARLEQRIVDIVDSRLAAMEQAGGTGDLIEIFALPISSLVICELLGVPYADRAEFQRRSVRGTDITLSFDERAVIERESRSYMRTLVERTRRRPGSGILGMLVREHGGELTDDELAGIGSLLLLAGHETTATMIGLGTLALLRHPDQLALMRDDPDAVGPGVEELLRWLSIVQTGQTRFTTTDVEMAGVVIPARHPVYASVPVANRDPAFIDNPEILDIRRGAPGHLAFGHGVHRCLGAPLARMQMRIAIPALLRRFPQLALAEPFEQVSFRSSNFIYGLNSLHVTW